MSNNDNIPIHMPDITRELHFDVRVTGVRQTRVRVWLMRKLIWLAGFIGGIGSLTVEIMYDRRY